MRCLTPTFCLTHSFWASRTFSFSRRYSLAKFEIRLIVIFIFNEEPSKFTLWGPRSHCRVRIVKDYADTVSA